MPETIVVNLGADVASGPTINETRSLTVDAYDKLSVTVPDGSTNLEVQLQPGGSGTVQLLIVRSSLYGKELTYTVNADSNEHVLDQPHVLIGAGAVALLDSAPTRLLFDNALGAGKDAQIQILIGRDATP